MDLRSKIKEFIKTLKAAKYSDEDIRNTFMEVVEQDTPVSKSVSQISTNLAIFSKRVGDVKTKNSSLLFFSTDDTIEKKDNSDNLVCYCLFCRKKVCCIIKDSVDVTNLKNHLGLHIDIKTFISRYPKVANLLANIPIQQVVSNTMALSTSIQKDIHTFYKPASKRVHLDSRENQGVELGVMEIESIKEKDFQLNNINKEELQRLLVTVALGVSFSWYERIKANCGQDVADFLTTFLHRYPARKLPIVVGEMKRLMCDYFLSNKYMSMCCDGWSVVKPPVSMEAFVVTTFKENQFRSFLYDLVSYESTTADALKQSTSHIIQQLQSHVDFITTDGARNNLAAFGENRSICFSHAINTVVSHMMEDPNKRKPSQLKYGINLDECKVLSVHFLEVHNLCVKVRGHIAKEFREWVSEWSSINIDFPDSIPLPENFCVTRWLGIAVEMNWLLQYGYLLYRFSLVRGYTQLLKGLCNTLNILKETSWFIFMLERCMSLLMVEDKPTIHLVVPILEGIKTALCTEPCISFQHAESKAIAKLIAYELEHGALSLDKPEVRLYKKYCYTATALYPEADKLVSTALLELCTEAAKDMFNNIMNEHNLNAELQCNEFDYIISSLRRKDNYLFQEGDFINYLKPSATALIFRGLPTITKLYFKERLMPDGSSSNVKVLDGKVKKETKKQNKRSQLEYARSKKKEKSLLNQSLNTPTPKDLEGYFATGSEVECHDLTTVKSSMKSLNQVNLENAKREMEKEVQVCIANAVQIENTPTISGLYDFQHAYYASCYIDGNCPVLYSKNSGLQLLMEKVLCIPATEAACERVFRKSSLFTKRSYVTNVSSDTVMNVTYCKQHLKAIWQIIIQGKKVRDCFEWSVS